MRMISFTAVLFTAVITSALLTSCSQKVPAGDLLPSQPPITDTEPGNGQNTLDPAATSPVTPEPERASASPAPATYPDILDLQFSDLTGLRFDFSSGAGAWNTGIEISSDGTFSGLHTDQDMGDTGPGYPNGTRYTCVFSGKFSELKKTGDYTYSMKCEALKQEGTPGKEEIEDGFRYITSEPYGFDNADEFILYLPGKKIAELPEDFIMWMHWRVNVKSTDVMSFYGLYNVGGAKGFCSTGQHEAGS